MYKWISPKDSLPDCGKYCFVILKKKNKQLIVLYDDFYNGKDGDWFECATWFHMENESNIDSYYTNDIKCWMAIEFPKY